ncbi:Hypothetical predicted protein [Lynx pardinus]|uniref:Uncharacterized protein n=1 Tax=Lynx pardinus TaxID=191816 RepID=A0A485NDA9_LYNPA|nr:Hypothetical predicted protein [Lynx pardinus]
MFLSGHLSLGPLPPTCFHEVSHGKEDSGQEGHSSGASTTSLKAPAQSLERGRSQVSPYQRNECLASLTTLEKWTRLDSNLPTDERAHGGERTRPRSNHWLARDGVGVRPQTSVTRSSGHTGRWSKGRLTQASQNRLRAPSYHDASKPCLTLLPASALVTPRGPGLSLLDWSYQADPSALLLTEDRALSPRDN